MGSVLHVKNRYIFLALVMLSLAISGCSKKVETSNSESSTTDKTSQSLKKKNNAEKDRVLKATKLVETAEKLLTKESYESALKSVKELKPKQSKLEERLKNVEKKIAEQEQAKQELAEQEQITEENTAATASQQNDAVTSPGDRLPNETVEAYQERIGKLNAQIHYDEDLRKAQELGYSSVEEYYADGSNRLDQQNAEPDYPEPVDPPPPLSPEDEQSLIEWVEKDGSYTGSIPYQETGEVPDN